MIAGMSQTALNSDVTILLEKRKRVSAPAHFPVGTLAGNRSCKRDAAESRNEKMLGKRENFPVL